MRVLLLLLCHATIQCGWHWLCCCDGVGDAVDDKADIAGGAEVGAGAGIGVGAGNELRDPRDM